jgi:hypothetical protein
MWMPEYNTDGRERIHDSIIRSAKGNRRSFDCAVRKIARTAPLRMTSFLFFLFLLAGDVLKRRGGWFV